MKSAIIENLTVGLYILYVLNTHIKFLSIWKLSTIQSINFLCIIFYLKILKFKHVIDEIIIDF